MEVIENIQIIEAKYIFVKKGIIIFSEKGKGTVG